MEIKIDVKFNIGDKVYVRNRNNGRMDTDGEGIIEGYIINKTKKSCKKSLDYLVSLVAMTSMLIFVIRKKNN